MISPIFSDLRYSWKPLAITHIAFKILSFVILVPAVTILFRLFVELSGRQVLADVDIARFLIHPIGLVTLIVIASAQLTILAFEISALLLVCFSSHSERPISPKESLWIVYEKSKSLFRVSGQMVIRVLLITVPFLAIGGGIYLWLLTKHDINFYLSNTPSEFVLAVILIGVVLLSMLGFLCYVVLGWVYAIPMLLVEHSDPKTVLRESNERVSGDRKGILVIFLCWAAVTFTLRFAVAWFVVTAAQFVVPLLSVSLIALVISVVLALGIVTLANLIADLIAQISLSTCMAAIYRRNRGIEVSRALPSEDRPDDKTLLRWTRGRVLSVFAVGTLAAAIIGSSLLHGISLEDDVEITAHRGGAYHAPENTMAAVRRGIEDGADWIEIDVQESRDGTVVVVHDSDLMKVAGNPVKIWEADYEELRSIDIGSFFDEKYSGERMPTLREVLDACRDKAGVNIELKYYGHDQRLEERVVEIVEAAGMESQIVVMSLEAKAVTKMKALRPDWTVGQLTAVAIGDLTRLNADFLAVKDSIATSVFVQSAHRQGKEVAAWTLNDAYSMSLMISRGVDNLITDRPALAHEVLRQRAEMSPVERMSLEVAYLLGIKPNLTKYKPVAQ